jgi:hypothetical protein
LMVTDCKWPPHKFADTRWSRLERVLAQRLDIVILRTTLSHVDFRREKEHAARLFQHLYRG